MRAVLVVCVLLLAGCAQTVDEPLTEPGVSGTPPNPLEMGPLAMVQRAFNLGNEVIAGDGQAQYLVELRGQIYESDAGGPVVIIMHGRHGTCEITPPQGMELLLQPCPSAEPVIGPVPSYLGYEDLAEYLVSHGFTVLSVDANNVNDRDNDYSFAGGDYGATARGNIILRVIEELPSLVPDADHSRIGLMGHSRGGEGVVAAVNIAQGQNHFAADAIDAVFALAPTDFKRWTLQDVAFGTLLPYCDGDVSTLHGSWMFDDSRGEPERGPLHQFVAMGANHNFYNTVWDRDDFGNRGDPWCDAGSEDGGRDSPEEQLAHGTMVMGAFMRAYVGNDAKWLRYLDGEAAWPLPVQTSYYPAAAQTEWDLQVQFDHLRGFDDFVVNGPATVQACPATDCPSYNTYGTAGRHVFSWTGNATMALPATMETGEWFTARFGVDPERPAAMLDNVRIQVGDVEMSLRELGIRVPPGEQYAKTLLNGVAVQAEGNVEMITIHLTGSGWFETTDWLVYSSR